MKDDTVYLVYAVHLDKDDSEFAACYTKEEAEDKIQDIKETWWGGPDRYKQYWEDFVVREKVVETDFVIPSQGVRSWEIDHDRVTSAGGTSIDIVVKHQDGREFSFKRNYFAFYRTFEPFQQYRNGAWHEYALIGQDYQFSDVMDLQTGEIVAEEPRENATRRYVKDGEEKELTGMGFCPVAFYVPDWWDVHDESIIPGSRFWDESNEKPTGDFGFVMGCVWGDDWSWKIQYLDLSEIDKGIVHREERFGYQPIDLPPYDQELSSAIRYDPETETLTLSVPKRFNRLTGESYGE